MEDEALQCAEVRPAELIYYRIHSSYHLPLVWLTLGGGTSHSQTEEQFTFSEPQPEEVWTTARYWKI